MAVQQLNFQGINRAITDFSSTSACEELINLRPTGTGLVPVKPFGIKMLGITYDKVFVHKASKTTNYIALQEAGNGISIIWVSEDGRTVLQTLLSGLGTTADKIHFAYAGNYILFSVKDDEESVYSNLAWLWDGSTYNQKNASIPEISHSFSTDSITSHRLFLDESEQPYQSTNPTEVHDFLSSRLNGVTEENKNACFGVTIFAIAFKTTTGDTFWTNEWFIYDPTKEFLSESGIDDGVYRDSDTGHVRDLFSTFFLSHDLGFHHHFEGHYIAGANYFIAPVPRLEIQMQGVYDNDASFIKSVEVYASRPVLYQDVDAILNNPSDYVKFGDGYVSVMLPQKEYKDMGLESQLLFLQKSISLDELASGPVSFNLEFGGNIQTTGKTLATDAGAITRFGNILAYNSRFHFYDSSAKIEFSMPDFLYDDGSSTPVSAEVFLLHNDGQKMRRLYLGTKNLPTEQASLVISPNAGVVEVLTQQYSSSENLWYMRTYKMEPSSRYNYSICINGTDWESYPVRKYNPIDYPLYVLMDEQSAINVTEQYNPFVFKVEHSYLAPGKVIDVQPQMIAVRDVTFGDYPLNVFTDRGVYALLQGNGTVLYGNFRSISNLVITSNSIPTENGTFFIAAGGLWLVAGDSAVLVSDALSLGPHKFIRSSAGYQAISAQAVDATLLLSDPIFEKYVEGAKLSYNRYRDELFVSNPEYHYSYVLSLKYRQWFKMSVRIWQDVPGSNIATTKLVIPGFYNIVDFSDEIEDTSVLVHLQSRPFSFSGYMYTHIHRIISMVRTALSNTDILVVALYGSDDLQEWVLLSYAGRSSKSEDTPLRVSQLRTPPAARSWRYYTICIGGNIPTDTDFGPVMVDYQPVIRRLG